MKPWYQSKTLWIAFLQGLGGLIIAAVGQYPSSEYIGVFMMVKSLIDAILRVISNEKIR